MSSPDAAESQSALNRRQPIREILLFFVLTFVLTIPFWAVSAASGKELLPGLPLAALAVVCPAAAALFLACRQGGMMAPRALLARCLDVGRVRPLAWWLLIVLIMPSVSLVSFLILRIERSGIPNPQIHIFAAAALFVVFLVAALCEELGWSGFALDPLQARLGAIPAALLIGAVWAIWHYPALLQAHRSAGWIAWWTLGTVSMRLFMIWLYNRTGQSVFSVVIVHAVMNLCWQLYPIHGSWFDPRLNGEIMGGVALMVVLASIRQKDAARSRTKVRA